MNFGTKHRMNQYITGLPKVSICFLVGNGKWGIFIKNANYYLHPLNKDGNGFLPYPSLVFPNEVYSDACYVLSCMMNQDTDVLGINPRDFCIRYSHEQGGPCPKSADLWICFLQKQSWIIESVFNIKGNGSFRSGMFSNFISDPTYQNNYYGYLTEENKNRLQFIYSQITGKSIPNSYFYFHNGIYAISSIGG